jgi:hypothetical protein
MFLGKHILLVKERFFSWNLLPKVSLLGFGDLISFHPRSEFSLISGLGLATERGGARGEIDWISNVLC